MCFGLYLAWQLRKAAGDAGEVGELCERRSLTAALLLELLSSTVLYVGRHVLLLRAHPDHAFLAYFARTHLTVTLSLLLILVPKVCYLLLPCVLKGRVVLTLCIQRV